MDDAAASGEGTRAGSRALSVFAHALTGSVLRAHAGGPLRFAELEDALPWASQTSLRFALGRAGEVGALAKLPPARGERGAAHQLTPAGRDLLHVGDSLEGWLRQSPAGPISLTDAAGPNAIGALAGGWDSTVVRELAERPCTHTELSARIAGHSHYALGRRLAKLRSTRLVVGLAPAAGGRFFEPSEWLRHAIAPLCVAAAWERTHLGEDAPPIGRLEVEAAFLLTLPLVTLDPLPGGGCALVVLTTPGEGEERGSELAGVSVTVEEGKLVSRPSGDSFSPNSWALGTADAWLAAVVEGRLCGLRVHGEDESLPVRIVQGIHQGLFPPRSSYR